MQFPTVNGLATAKLKLLYETQRVARAKCAAELTEIANVVRECKTMLVQSRAVTQTLTTDDVEAVVDSDAKLAELAACGLNGNASALIEVRGLFQAAVSNTKEGKLYDRLSIGPEKLRTAAVAIEKQITLAGESAAFVTRMTALAAQKRLDADAAVDLSVPLAELQATLEYKKQQQFESLLARVDGAYGLLALHAAANAALSNGKSAVDSGSEFERRVASEHIGSIVEMCGYSRAWLAECRHEFDECKANKLAVEQSAFWQRCKALSRPFLLADFGLSVYEPVKDGSCVNG
jgi:hypothetical protein